MNGACPRAFLWDSTCVTAVRVCRVNIMDGDAIAGQICVSGRVDEMAESYRRVLEDPTPAVRGWPVCVWKVWLVGTLVVLTPRRGRL